jgi:hypothetical protein
MFDNEIPLNEAMSMYAPNVMAGTLTPEKMQQQKQQDALVEALRAMGSGNTNPMASAQGGRVVSTGSAASGLNAGVIGGALNKGFGSTNPAPADLAGTSFI